MSACQHELSKITNTIVRNYYFAVVCRACNATFRTPSENPLLRFPSAQNFFPLVLCNMPVHKISNVKKSDDPNN